MFGFLTDATSNAYISRIRQGMNLLSAPLDCSGSTCPVGTLSQKSLKLKTVSFSENGSHLQKKQQGGPKKYTPGEVAQRSLYTQSRKGAGDGL